MATWQNQLKGDSLAWLLAPDSPGVRYLALRDLLDLPKDDPDLLAARKRAHTEGPIAVILDQMNEEGFWAEPGAGYSLKYRSTVWSIIQLAQLGASVSEDQRIERACRYLMAHALTPGGQFSSTGDPSGTVACLQGNLCWALAESGYTDPRLAMAFEWMARSVTGEGVSPVEEKQARVRYYSYHCGPNFACGVNNKNPCAWGATKILLAFGKMPEEYRSPVAETAIQQGIRFILDIDPAEARYPTASSGKPNQSWWKFGFPVFYITDLLQIMEVMTGLGYGRDARLANVLTLILEKQDQQGRWKLEHDYPGKTWVDYGEKNQPNKWVTLRALRVLRAVA